MSYIVDSGVDERFTLEHPVRRSAQSSTSLSLYLHMVSTDSLGKHAARENPAALSDSLLKNKVNQPSA